MKKEEKHKWINRGIMLFVTILVIIAVIISEIRTMKYEKTCKEYEYYEINNIEKGYIRCCNAIYNNHEMTTPECKVKQIIQKE